MNTKDKSSLLCRPEEDALVRRDVLVHEPQVLEAVRVPLPSAEERRRIPRSKGRIECSE